MSGAFRHALIILCFNDDARVGRDSVSRSIIGSDNITVVGRDYKINVTYHTSSIENWIVVYTNASKPIFDNYSDDESIGVFLFIIFNFFLFFVFVWLYIFNALMRARAKVLFPNGSRRPTRTETRGNHLTPVPHTHTHTLGEFLTRRVPVDNIIIETSPWSTRRCDFSQTKIRNGKTKFNL